jgi:hypothetical protein
MTILAAILAAIAAALTWAAVFTAATSAALIAYSLRDGFFPALVGFIIVFSPWVLCLGALAIYGAATGN